MIVESGASFEGAIGGFAVGGSIDITNLSPSAVAADFDATTDVLTTPDDGSLQFAGDGGDTFVLSPDGGDGADVTIACYRVGTRILAAQGEVAIERLAIGDLVMTLSGSLRPIRWIGRRSYTATYAFNNPAVRPILIEAGALGGGLPRRALWVSPEHAMYLDGMLIPARALVDGGSIRQPESSSPITYLHLEFGRHEVIRAEGAWSESFVDDDSRGRFENAAEFALRYPEEPRLPARYCAPRVEDGEAVEQVRRRLRMIGSSAHVGAGARRRFLRLAAGGALTAAISRRFACAAAVEAAPGKADTPDSQATPAVRAIGTARAASRLVLLGTGGGPTPKPNRAASSQAIIVDGVTYLVDCGNGVGQQMAKAKIRFSSLRNVFITHHHSDHNADYGNVLLLGWATDLTSRVDTYGPPPLVRMTRLFLELNAVDIRTRIADEGRAPLAGLIHAHEISRPGLVMRDERVTVTAALVEHPPLSPAFAYRFDCPDRSIVISGDTRMSDSLIALAQGADILVHEVMYLPAIDALVATEPNAPRLKAHMLNAHTTTEDVGRAATAAGVKTLVLSHFVPGGYPFVADDVWFDAVRPHFAGTLVVGSDLMEL